MYGESGVEVLALAPCDEPVSLQVHVDDDNDGVSRESESGSIWLGADIIAVGFAEVADVVGSDCVGHGDAVRSSSLSGSRLRLGGANGGDCVSHWYCRSEIVAEAR